MAEIADVRRLLAEARDAGQTFGDAWPRALELANGFADLLHQHAPAWRRAYEGLPPTRAEHALVVVASSTLERRFGVDRAGSAKAPCAPTRARRSARPRADRRASTTGRTPTGRTDAAGAAADHCRYPGIG